MKYKIWWHWKDGQVSQYPPFVSLADALNFIQKDHEIRPDLTLKKDILENTRKIEIVFLSDS